MLAEVQHFIYEAEASGADVKVYTMPTDVALRGSGTIYGNTHYTWNKPPSAKWVHIIVQGAGGSGTTAGTNTSTLGCGAGGGGGSGQYTCGWWPAFMLPDTLYVGVGSGQSAPTGSASESKNGCPSYVALDVMNSTITTNSTSILLYAQGSDGFPGTGSILSPATSSTGATTAAGGGASSTITNQPRVGSGIWKANTAPMGGGGAGGANTGDARGESLSSFAAARFYGPAGPGGGGGGCAAITSPGAAHAGGVPWSSSVSATAGLGQVAINYANSDTSVAGAAANGAGNGVPAQNGQSGVVNKFLWVHNGGGGGGGSGNTAGSNPGNGGDGILGSGGGGAGGGFNLFPLAIPGRGGDGFVVIIAG